MGTVKDAEKPSQKPKSKGKGAPNADPKSTTPSPDEIWIRQNKIEKVLLNLVPKVEAVFKALEEFKTKKADNPGPDLPPAPQGKALPELPGWLVDIGKTVAENLTAPSAPEADPFYAVHKEAYATSFKSFLEAQDVERKLGRSLLDHIAKNGWKGIIKFGEAE